MKETRQSVRLVAYTPNPEHIIAEEVKAYFNRLKSESL